MATIWDLDRRRLRVAFIATAPSGARPVNSARCCGSRSTRRARNIAWPRRCEARTHGSARGQEHRPSSATTQGHSCRGELVVRTAEFKDLLRVSELLVASFEVVSPMFSGFVRAYFFRIAVLEYYIGILLRQLFQTHQRKVLVAEWREAQTTLAGTIELTTIDEDDAVLSYPFPLAEAFRSPLEPGFSSGPVDASRESGQKKSKRHDQKLPYMQNLAVDATVRRGGVGRALVQACEEIAQSQGHAALYLHYLETAETPGRFWTSLGYQSLARDNFTVPILRKLFGLEVRRFAGKRMR
ncbi:hypothetical protein FVE85_1134 [Porphyridium purpureum]|uniref:N-acetyltransferase domain-containing protein n=1 Tax=Porphyridium purpureum TaxID=35688 RepID=A0A5J4Z279_PORPP|nr:hypothetical protein FVE85_1134 [Porphyridium purpureum]|eukprot:POR1296..scf208_2